METLKMRFIIYKAAYTHMNNWHNDIKIFHKIIYLFNYFPYYAPYKEKCKIKNKFLIL